MTRQPDHDNFHFMISSLDFLASLTVTERDLCEKYMDRLSTLI